MNQTALLNEVDEVIKMICKKIQNGEVVPEERLGTIMALATLIEARATLIT